MPVICELRDDIKEYLEARKLFKKWEKAKKLFEQNPEYLFPSFRRIPYRSTGQAPESRNYLRILDTAPIFIGVTRRYDKSAGLIGLCKGLGLFM